MCGDDDGHGHGHGAGGTGNLGLGAAENCGEETYGNGAIVGLYGAIARGDSKSKGHRQTYDCGNDSPKEVSA